MTNITSLTQARRARDRRKQAGQQFRIGDAVTIATAKPGGAALSGTIVNRRAGNYLVLPLDGPRFPGALLSIPGDALAAKRGQAQ